MIAITLFRKEAKPSGNSHHQIADAVHKMRRGWIPALRLAIKQTLLSKKFRGREFPFLVNDAKPNIPAKLDNGKDLKKQQYARFNSDIHSELMQSIINLSFSDDLLGPIERRRTTDFADLYKKEIGLWDKCLTAQQSPTTDNSKATNTEIIQSYSGLKKELFLNANDTTSKILRTRLLQFMEFRADITVSSTDVLTANAGKAFKRLKHLLYHVQEGKFYVFNPETLSVDSKSFENFERGKSFNSVLPAHVDFVFSQCGEQSISNRSKGTSGPPISKVSRVFNPFVLSPSSSNRDEDNVADPLADSMSASQLWDHNWASNLIRLEADGPRSQAGSLGGNTTSNSVYSSAFSGKTDGRSDGSLSNAIRRGNANGSDDGRKGTADSEKAEQNVKQDHSSYEEYRALDGSAAANTITDSLTRGSALGWLRVRNKTVLPFDMVLKYAQKAFELAARPGESGAKIAEIESGPDNKNSLTFFGRFTAKLKSYAKTGWDVVTLKKVREKLSWPSKLTFEWPWSKTQSGGGSGLGADKKPEKVSTDRNVQDEFGPDASICRVRTVFADLGTHAIDLKTVLGTRYENWTDFAHKEAVNDETEDPGEDPRRLLIRALRDEMRTTLILSPKDMNRMRKPEIRQALINALKKTVGSLEYEVRRRGFASQAVSSQRTLTNLSSYRSEAKLSKDLTRTYVSHVSVDEPENELLEEPFPLALHDVDPSFFREWTGDRMLGRLETVFRRKSAETDGVGTTSASSTPGFVARIKFDDFFENSSLVGQCSDDLNRTAEPNQLNSSENATEIDNEDEDSDSDESEEIGAFSKRAKKEDARFGELEAMDEAVFGNKESRTSKFRATPAVSVALGDSPAKRYREELLCLKLFQTLQEVLAAHEIGAAFSLTQFFDESNLSQNQKVLEQLSNEQECAKPTTKKSDTTTTALMREVWCERIQAMVPKIEAELLSEAALPREKNPFREPKVLRKIFNQKLRRLARRLFLPLFLFGDANSRLLALSKSTQHNSTSKVQAGMGSKLLGLAKFAKAKEPIMGHLHSQKRSKFTPFYVRKNAFHERSRSNNSGDELAERSLLFLTQSHIRLEDRYDHFNAETELYRKAQGQHPTPNDECHSRL